MGVAMWHILIRILEGQVCNSTAVAPWPSTAIWSRKLDSSRITKFVTEFFAAELRAWRGEQPLRKVFWVYGVAASGVLIAFYAIAFYENRVALRQVLLLCFAFYTVWILVSVWRCVNNTEDRIWGLFARLLTVAWAGNTIMIVVFLQLNLITRYYLQH